VRFLATISDSAGEGAKSLDSEFENHIPFLFEAYSSTKNKSPEYRRYLLTTLANLSIRDYLRPIIIDHKGIQMFLAALRDPTNLEGMRIAAKGLVNLTSNRRDY
jgi:hypothetical protein